MRKNYIKEKIMSVWQHIGNNFVARPKVSKTRIKKWFFLVRLKKREHVGITRLRLGHIRLTRTSMLLNNNNKTT